MRKPGTWIPIAVTALSLVTGSTPTAAQDPLIFAGSGTNLPITRRLAEAFGRSHPEIKISVPESLGSSGGIRAAAEGAVAVGLTSRALREREKGLGLRVVTYARTAVVLGVNAAVADDAVSSEDLIRIYDGTKTRWRDGREIIVLTREPGDSSLEVLEEKIPGFKAAYAESYRARRWVVLFTDQEMHRVLAKSPSAIGLLDQGAITAERLPIKPLRIDGVAPTAENVLRGTYPLVKTLSFVFRADRLPSGARAFVDFARSPAARKVLASNGYLPVE